MEQGEQRRRNWFRYIIEAVRSKVRNMGEKPEREKQEERRIYKEQLEKNIDAQKRIVDDATLPQDQRDEAEKRLSHFIAEAAYAINRGAIDVDKIGKEIIKDLLSAEMSPLVAKAISPVVYTLLKRKVTVNIAEAKIRLTELQASFSESLDNLQNDPRIPQGLRNKIANHRRNINEKIARFQGELDAARIPDDIKSSDIEPDDTDPIDDSELVVPTNPSEHTRQVSSIEQEINASEEVQSLRAKNASEKAIKMFQHPEEAREMFDRAYNLALEGRPIDELDLGSRTSAELKAIEKAFELGSSHKTSLERMIGHLQQRKTESPDAIRDTIQVLSKDTAEDMTLLDRVDNIIARDEITAAFDQMTLHPDDQSARTKFLETLDRLIERGRLPANDKEYLENMAPVEAIRQRFSDESALRLFVEKYSQLQQLVTVDLMGPGERVEFDRLGFKPADFTPFSEKSFVERIKSDPSAFFEKVDGKVRIKRNKQQDFIQGGNNLINKLLMRVSSDGGMEWQEVWDQLIEGRMQRTLRNFVANFAESTDVHDAIVQKLQESTFGLSNREAEEAADSFKSFFKSEVIQEMNNEVKMRQAYHMAQFLIVEGNGDPETMVKFNAKFPASRLNTLVTGYHGRIVEMAISEFERDLQSRIAQNKNYLPQNVFNEYFEAKEGKSQGDRDRIKDRLKFKIRHLQQLVIDGKINRDDIDDELYVELKNIKPWEIDRVLSIAPGISLLNTLRGHEITAMAVPEQGRFTAQPQFAQYFNIRHKWGMGRGLESFFEVQELFDLDVELGHLDKNLVKRLFSWMFESVKSGKKKRWVPKRFYEAANKAKFHTVEELGKELGNIQLSTDEKGTKRTVRELLGHFSAVGLTGQKGWRTDPLKNWYADHNNGKDIDSDWGESYFNLSKQVGVGSRWLFDRDRVEAETSSHVQSNILNIKNDPKFSKSERKTMYASLKSGKEKRKKVQFQTEGGSDMLTIREFEDKKVLEYRAYNFKDLLERSPYDFLINMLQLEPGLNQLYGDQTAYEYMFESRRTKSKDAQIEYNKMSSKWGKENMPYIEKVAKFYHDLYTAKDGGQDLYGKTEDGKTMAEDHMYNIMSTATEKLKLQKRRRMVEGDVSWEDGEGGINEPHVNTIKSLIFQLRKELVGDPTIDVENEVERGKVKTASGDTFYLGEAKLGKYGFFHKVASRWFEHDQIAFDDAHLPNTNETRVGPMIEYMAHPTKGVGDDIYKRLWGDVQEFNEAIKDFQKLPSMLKSAAMKTVENPEISPTEAVAEIIEFQKKIKDLKTMIGHEPAQRMNYILSTMVGRFYLADYRVRYPQPIAFFRKLFRYREVSLAQIVKNHPQAMAWDGEDFRLYIESLTNSGILSHDGEWSREKILRAFEADDAKYLSFEAGPSIIMLILMTLAATGIQAGLKDDKK